MATKYLDNTGLAYFWGKIKSWVSSRGYITSSGSITGNAATATRLAGPKHSYTTAANAAKNWYRIANANTSQIDTSKPLHVQFMLTAYNTPVNNDYYQRWFVDCEVFGRQSGIRLFGNSAKPFLQIRVLYENTDASVTASNRPAIDIYLNYVIASATSIKIEEINNSGFDFLADGVLTASTVPTGFESRSVGVYGSGINNCGTADYATYHYLYSSTLSANTTLSAWDTNHRYRILNCTGTITLTVPSWNSSSGWFFIKNNGTGVVTVHPASTSVMFDNVSADITLQPGEFIRLACQSNNHYSIVDDGRWKSQKAEASHVHGSITNDGKLGTASRAVQTDANGDIGVSSVTATELGYLSGATSTIQTQIDSKADDSNVVHKTGDESISGTKTFNNNFVISSNGAIKKTSKSGILTLCGGRTNDVDEGAYMYLFGAEKTNQEGWFALHACYDSQHNSSFIAKPNGTLTWNGQNIQVSSDERLKTALSKVPDSVLDAWGCVDWGQFCYLDAVSDKGAAARLHVGLIAQAVKKVFEEKGLDATRYGILCHEERTATDESPAVDLWMIRYVEALAMEAVFQRRRADRLEARIAALEEKLNG